MKEKPKAAFYWCSTCGGCEESVVDLAEKILDVVAAIDIVFWPVALDFKLEDVESLKDKEIAVCFINGAIRTSEDVHVSKLLRQKSQLIVAYGSCSHLGGIPGLANFWNKESIFQKVYKEAPTIQDETPILPQEETEINGLTLTLPKFFNTVRRLDEVIDVDYYIPGCAPNPDLLLEAVQLILSGNLPPKGSILSPNRNMCEDCPLERKEEKIQLQSFFRPFEIIPEPGRCLLEQGIICLGPVTRVGCGALCMKVSMPCRGCYGPTDGVQDMGTKFASALASIVDIDDDQQFMKLIASIPNYSGLVYMFSLPSSYFKRKNMEAVKNE